MIGKIMCDRAVISTRYHETHCLHVGKGQPQCNQCSKCFWTGIAERVLRSLLMRTFRVVYPLVSIFLFILTDIVMDYYRDRSTLIEAWYGSYREWCRIIHHPCAVDFFTWCVDVRKHSLHFFFYYFPTLRWCGSPTWTTGVLFNWHRQYHGSCWPGGQGLNIDKYSSFSNIRFSLLTWAQHIGRSMATAQTHVLTPEIVCHGHDVTNTKTCVEIFIVVMAW